MRNQLVYDLPTRVFHWLFAGFFVTAIFIAKTIDEDSPTHAYHMLAGLVLGHLVVLRLVWGFVGTKYARFNSFALRPKELKTYFVEIFSGGKRKWAGHNPASSWAGLIMMTLALGLSVSGFFMASGYKESLEDIHELLANSFLVAAILHVLGIVWHTLRHKDAIGLSMLDGAKSDLTPADAISDSKPIIALVFLGLVTAFVIYLANHFDEQQRQITLYGATLQLGENESHEHGEDKYNDDDNHKDSDDHD